MNTDLVDLKRPKPKKNDNKVPTIEPCNYYEPYGYGTRLCLGDEELDKLGIDVTKLKVGTEIKIKATGQIIEAGIREEVKNGKTQKDQRVEIQIQKLSLADDGNFEDGWKEEKEED